MWIALGVIGYLLGAVAMGQRAIQYFPENKREARRVANLSRQELGLHILVIAFFWPYVLMIEVCTNCCARVGRKAWDAWR